MTNTKLTILPELQNLLPPLTDEEFAGLEAGILKDGCLSPLVVWNNTLIDGHHRYEICRKHTIPFSVQKIVFDTLDEAKIWMWRHQENRRNLTPFQRAEIALKVKDAVAAKAKEQQGRKDIRPEEAIETRRELGKLAGISHNTLTKAEYLVKNANEETKAQLRRGGKGISIHREYTRLRSIIEHKPIIPKNSICQEQEAKNDQELYCVPAGQTATPQEWAAWFLKNKSDVFLRELFEAVFAEYYQCVGDKTAKTVILNLCNKYI